MIVGAVVTSLSQRVESRARLPAGDGRDHRGRRLGSGASGRDFVVLPVTGERQSLCQSVTRRSGGVQHFMRILRAIRRPHHGMHEMLQDLLLRTREIVMRALRHDDEDGQGMVEYALILVLIAVVVIVVLTTVGKQVNNVFSNISHGLGT